jgi:hypothetical protein
VDFSKNVLHHGVFNCSVDVEGWDFLESLRYEAAHIL